MTSFRKTTSAQRVSEKAKPRNLIDDLRPAWIPSRRLGKLTCKLIHSSQERRTLGGQSPWRLTAASKLFRYPLDFVPDGTYLRKLLGDCQRTGITLSYCGILPRQFGQTSVHHFQNNRRRHSACVYSVVRWPRTVSPVRECRVLRLKIS